MIQTVSILLKQAQCLMKEPSLTLHFDYAAVENQAASGYYALLECPRTRMPSLLLVVVYVSVSNQKL